MEVLEKHHPDKKNFPKLTLPISYREHKRLHHIETLDTPLSRKMREYDKVNSILVAMKN
jgi:hypothetical protein